MLLLSLSIKRIFDLFSNSNLVKYYMGFFSALCVELPVVFEAGNDVCPARMNNGRHF